MAGVKNVSPPYKLYNAVSVSGTGVSISSASSILYKDNIGLQFSYTGNTTGTLDVQVSNDFNLGLPESAGTLNAGTWTSVTQSAPNTLPVIVGSGTGSIAINLNLSGFSFLRTQYTSSSGSGTLTGWIVAKSLG